MSTAYGPIGSYRKLSTKSLNVDRKYQRGEEMRYARKIAAEFEWSRFSTLVVSRRKGSFFVVDGQHRAVAAGLLKIDRVPCLVFNGLAVKDEAAAYCAIQTDRRSVHPIAMFKAELVAEIPLAVETNKTLVRYGMRAGFPSGNETQFLSSVKLAKELQRKGILGDCLHILTGCWPDSKLITSAIVLRGVSHFVHLYQAEGTMDAADMLKRLKAQSLEKTYNTARASFEMQGYAGRGLARTIAANLVALYNKRLRAEKRMDPDHLLR